MFEDDAGPTETGPAETESAEAGSDGLPGPDPEAGEGDGLAANAPVTTPLAADARVTTPLAADTSVTTPLAPRRRPLLGYLAAALVGVAATLGLLLGSGTIALDARPAPTFAAGGRSVGVATAPVTVEIWADFQCPYCGIFTHGVEPTLLRDEAARGLALVTFRDFAFLGQELVDAAVAARCADRQAAFWTYHDLLYASQHGENQGAFARDTLLTLADFAGLNRAAFATCLDDPALARQVQAETAAGRALGINSTPTVRVVGAGGSRVLKGVQRPAAIEAAIAVVAVPSASAGASAGASPGASSGATGSPSQTGGVPSGPADGSPSP